MNLCSVCCNEIGVRNRTGGGSCAVSINRRNRCLKELNKEEIEKGTAGVFTV